MPEDADLDIDFDQELAKIQAQAAKLETDTPGVIAGEVVDDGRTVEFMGERFRIADKIGILPLLKFANYSDVNINDMRGLAAMYALLRDCIYPGTPGCGKCASCKADREAECKDYEASQWPRFEEHAMARRAEADDIFDLINKVMEVISGRPTEPPSASSRGPRAISGGSTARSSGRRGKAPRR